MRVLLGGGCSQDGELGVGVNGGVPRGRERWGSRTLSREIDRTEVGCGVMERAVYDAWLCSRGVVLNSKSAAQQDFADRLWADRSGR